MQGFMYFLLRKTTFGHKPVLVVLVDPWGLFKMQWGW